MNYYPDKNEFSEEIFKNLHPLQHRLVFHTWLYKMLSRVFDCWDQIPYLGDTPPSERGEARLFLETYAKTPTYNVYRLKLLINGTHILRDTCDMPGAELNYADKYMWEQGVIYDETFDVDIYTDSNKVYIAPSNNTAMFVENITFSEIADYFWYRTTSRILRREEIQIAPSVSYETAFKQTDDVDTLLAYGYDVLIKPTGCAPAAEENVIDACRMANKKWITKTPISKRILNGYEIQDEEFEMMLSYALSNKKLLVKEDDTRMIFSAEVYSINGAGGLTRIMDLRHPAKISLAKEWMRCSLTQH